jgi:hypothetical protein
MEENKNLNLPEPKVYLRKNSLWIRFGCFLTGYNCKLLRQCSEASYKKLKKYTSAMLIVMIIWGAVGFMMAGEYFRMEFWSALIVGLVAVFMVIQIERQIILSDGKSKKVMWLRFLLGFVMAFIGAVILDQIIFKEDIEKEKLHAIQEEVKMLMPVKTAEVRAQIAALDSSIVKKERERAEIYNEISKKPKIYMPTVKRIKDSLGNVIQTTVITNSVPNPKIKIHETVIQQIEEIKKRKKELEDKVLNMRDDLENELKNKKGFLDELTLMYKVITKNYVALGFWSLWLFLLLLIELFVVFVKFGDRETDYEFLVERMNEMSKKL